MYQGNILSLPDGTGELVLWSPWMPKGGDRAAMTYEIVNTAGTVTAFEIEVWTKAREDRSAKGTRIAEATDFVYTSTGGFYSAKNISGFEELFRFRIHLESENADGATLIYRFLEPTWLNFAGSQS